MLSRRSVVLAAIAASAGFTARALAFETKTFDAKSFAAAQKAGKPILVAIHASWCPTCKAQKPILSELTAIKDLAALFNRTPLPTLKSYLTFHYLSDHAPYLPKRFG